MEHADWIQGFDASQRACSPSAQGVLAASARSDRVLWAVAAAS